MSDKENVIQMQLLPGQVQISENGVRHVINHEDVHVYEIDMISKYVDATAYSEDGRITVMLFVGEDTKHINTSTTDTTSYVFSFDPSEKWSVMAESARYTTRIVLWKRTKTDE